MQIRRLSLLAGAREARGLAVVIDVLRAFTTAAHVLANGAERIVPVATLEEAFELKRRHQGWVLMGERDGRRVEGFDHGNSPFEVMGVDFAGRTVIQTTEAGTRGLVEARGAEELLLGSFVVAGATVERILRARPDIVSLVAMGSRGVERSEEDELCAAYIEGLLLGSPPDFEEIKRRVRLAPSGAKFFDPAQPQYREEDLHMALELDRFGFVMRAIRGDRLYVVKERP